MTPLPYRVRARRQETHDTWTLALDPLSDSVEPLPGQFVMLYAQGVGEIPISTSGVSDASGALTHTVRSVGAVSAALCNVDEGSIVGVRGAFGTTWPLDRARGADLVIVAGGIGLAPLRPAVRHALAHRDDFRRVSVLVGARTPDDVLFTEELEEWRAHRDAELLVTVDAAAPSWRGRVGLVTSLVPAARFHPEKAVAFVCGPEIMMTFVARALIDRGLPHDRIWVSTERNMRCGLGHCGHCQLGPLLLCRDGPVVRWDVVEPLMRVREL
jgi:NAD(P)H-flavin reductase